MLVYLVCGNTESVIYFRTLLKQETVVTVSGIPLSGYLEGYVTDSIQHNANKVGYYIHSVMRENKIWTTSQENLFWCVFLACTEDKFSSRGAYAKTKTQISFVVTAKLISAFVLATRIVQSLYFLNPKFQASSYLLWLYSPNCVTPKTGFLRTRFIYFHT